MVFSPRTTQVEKIVKGENENMFKHKTLWIVLTSVFAVLFVAMIVGTAIANSFKGVIDPFFGVVTYKVVTSDETDVSKTEYFKSPHVIAGKTWNGQRSKNGEDAYYDNEALKKSDYALGEEVEAEGASLLFNKGALPLAKGNKVSAFSISTTNLCYGGTGSGGVDTKNAPKLKAALSDAGLLTNETLEARYDALAAETLPGSRTKKYGRKNKSFFQTGQYSIGEVPWAEVAKDNVPGSFASYGDAAIVVLSRVGGEDNDLPRTNTDFKGTREGSWMSGELSEPKDLSPNDGKDGNFLALSAEEEDVLQNLKLLKEAGTFKKIVVLLNSCNPIECDFLTANKYDVDAALWIGAVGQTGINAVGDILVGDVIPSGSLPDTFYNDNLDVPAMVNFGLTCFENSGTEMDDLYTSSLYDELAKDGKTLDDIGADVYTVYEENIYLGYKYTETRYFDNVMGQGNAGAFDYDALVAYPFGHGESYTTFAYSDMTVSSKGDAYEVGVKVTNTGKTYGGKETVQIYLNAPYTTYDRQNKIEKSAVKLVGFGKTKILAPDESETLKISVDKQTFAAYDAFGAGTYVLDEGDYYLTAATDAHDAVNNILAMNGKTTADGMTANGNADLVKKALTLGKLDDDTFAKSDDTENPITNRFDNADLRRYENGRQADDFKLLSRSDWTGTYPTPIADRNKGRLTFTEQMKKDVSTADPVKIEEDPAAVMPEYGKKNGLSLAMFIGVDDKTAWDDLLDQMTFDEQDLLSSNAYHKTVEIVSVNKPATLDENGPIGLTKSFMGSDSKCMAYPSCPVMAATFNTELIRRMGEQIGLDALHANYQGLYGPGANIHRSPYSGRNFEYYSEDGILSGLICRAETLGIQSKGMYVYAKHFALNDQEAGRHGVCVFASEQTIRENYLTAFEYPLSKLAGNGHATMTSFNRIGVVWAGAHKGLLTDVLRNEWGFDGFALSDCWTDIADSYNSGNLFGNSAAAVLAGGDALDGKLTTQFTGKFTIDENYRKSPTFCQALRTSAKRILQTVANSSAMNGISSKDRIVSVLSWWQTALIAIDVVLGVLTAAAATLLVLTVVKKSRQNK